MQVNTTLLHNVDAVSAVDYGSKLGVLLCLFILGGFSATQFGLNLDQKSESKWVQFLFNLAPI